MQALRADLAACKTCFGKDLYNLLSLLFRILDDRISLCLLSSLLLHLRKLLLEGYAAFIAVWPIFTSPFLFISAIVLLPPPISPARNMPAEHGYTLYSN